MILGDADHAGVLPLERQFGGTSGMLKGNHAAASGMTPAWLVFEQVQKVGPCDRWSAGAGIPRSRFARAPPSLRERGEGFRGAQGLVI